MYPINDSRQNSKEQVLLKPAIYIRKQFRNCARPREERWEDRHGHLHR